MRIDHPIWQNVPELKDIFELLENRVRFVGGCVRDSLAGRPVTDIDLATVYEPEQVMDRLSKKGFSVIPTGIEFGTVTTVLHSPLYPQVEITTLRRDIKTDGRHAEVLFSKEWEEDAYRRDFTFNAIYSDFNGVLYDPCNGMKDLKEGLVRFIGRPEDRIQEDYLRILRYFRFFSFFSEQLPDPEALKACETYKEGVLRLSRDRVRKEFFTLLKGRKAYEALKLMEGISLLSSFFHEKIDLETFGRFKKSDPEAPLLYLLLSLLPPEEEAIRSFSLEWGISAKKRKEMLFTLKTPVQKEPKDFEEKDILRFLVFFGKEAALRLMSLNEARYPEEGWENLKIKAALRIVPEFDFSGADILKTDKFKASDIGKALRLVHEYWLERNGTPQKAELLSYLESIKI